MQSNHTFPQHTPQWGAVDAEIKVPFDENTELKGSTFKVVFFNKVGILSRVNHKGLHHS